MTDDLVTINARLVQFEATTGRRPEVLYLGKAVAARVLRTAEAQYRTPGSQDWTLFGVPVLRVLRAPEHVGVA